MEDNVIAKRVLQLGGVKEWTPGIRPTWNVTQVNAALYLHQQGDLSQSSLMVEAMLADDELCGDLSRACNMVVGAPFSLAPVTEDDEPESESEEIGELLGESWYKALPEEVAADLLAWRLMLGVAIATIDWDTRGSLWLPKVRVLHPQFLRLDQELGIWKFHGRDREEVVTPGDGRWILLGGSRSALMRAGVRALGATWLAKHYTWRDWNRYNERHGLPLVKAMVPAFSESSDKTAFVNKVSVIGSDTTVLLPTHLDSDGAAFDLQLLEAKDQAWDTFARTIERCDRKIQIFLLGSNAGTELLSSAGSRAASEASAETSKELATYRARLFSTELRDQLLKPWVVLTVGEVEDDYLPWPTWQTEPGETAEARAVGWKAAADAIAAWGTAGYDVSNAAEIAEEMGLVIEEKEVPPTLDGAVPPQQEEPMPPEEEPEEPETEELADSITSGAKESMVYVTALADELTRQADALEETEAETMARIIEESVSADDLKVRLADYANNRDAGQMAALFEKAILLSSLAGRFGAQEDL